MPSRTTDDKKRCVRCGKPLSWGDKFCSRQCKSFNQIKRITLTCFGCGKNFLVHPYRKRSTNYCSIKCYWDSTRRRLPAKCRVCGKNFQVKEYLVKKGFGFYCSRECQHKTYPKQVRKICPQCDKVYYVCPSWAPKRTYCSKKCQDDSMRDYVSRICRKCHKKFDLPRSDTDRGRGNFCTYRCYLTYRGPSYLEQKMEKALYLAGIKFEREIKFKRFHVDFLLRGSKSVIECDGEHWHLRPINLERDKRKDKLLTSLGYKVFRFTGKMLDQLTEKQLAKQVSNTVQF